MSITVTSDVFCDVCSQWVFGYVGPRMSHSKARRRAQGEGWKRIKIGGKLQDVCPDCQEERRRKEQGK